MINSLWLPKLNVDAAFRWLNCDTYWDIAEGDPADLTSTVIPPRDGSPQTAYPKQLKEKYPLTLLSGRPRQSRLRDLRQPNLITRTPIEQLILQLRADVSIKATLITPKRIQVIEDFCRPLQQINPAADRLQLTEAHLEFGRAYALLDDIASAIATLEECANDFHGNDLHDEAITLWMLGCVELIANDNPKNGLVAWERAWEIFADYAKDNRRPKAEINWYDARAQIMFADLQDAIALTQISVAPPSTTPKPPTPAAAATPKAQPSPVKKPAADHWLRFKQLDVYESVRAHPKGGIASKKSDTFVEVNTVWINDREYRLHSATDRRVVTLNPDPSVEYSFIRVEGDSMIEATPCPIMDGDYILVWIKSKPGDEKIVAATLNDPQTGDPTGTVKLKRSDGLHSKNSAKKYPVVPRDRVKDYVGEVIAVAKPL